MSDLDENNARERRMAAERLVDQLAYKEFGAKRIDRPLVLGNGVSHSVWYPEPLPAIKAAHLLFQVAQGRARDYAQDARADGHSWDVIGEALGLTEQAKRNEEQRGHLAFELCAGLMSSVWWRCGTCGQRVADGGPYNGPQEETGHADGCERHAREVAEQRATWDDD